MAKSFHKVWLSLIILFQSEILPPNSGEDQKKSLRRILDLSQSRILDFLLLSGYYLPENRGGQTYFAPFTVRPEGAPPPAPPKIDAYDTSYVHCLFRQYTTHGVLKYLSVIA